MLDMTALMAMPVSLDDTAQFISVIWLDLVLSGDNALVIGVAASTLPKHQQRQAVIFGLILATVIRIAFAGIATYLLEVPGLLFIGGLALIWVAYRLLRELMHEAPSASSASGAAHGIEPAGNLTRALISITIADVSMSIDNVLAVAAIARDDVHILVFGLALSIFLMGLGATVILRIMLRYPWISYVGVVLLVLIGGHMMYEGGGDMLKLIGGLAGA